MREQTTERIAFSYNDKKRILKKSEGKCAHCGKDLKLNEATIDHVIPISKGGTNEDANLIALCDECNYEKNDDVVNPAAYYKYIREEHRDSLKKQHDAYCDDVSWLTPKQYIKEDRMEVSYTSRNTMLRGHIKRRGNGLEVMGISHTAILSKARYNELEEISEYLEKYHKKLGLKTDHLKKSISDNFSAGCIYVLRKGSEIVTIFPVSIAKRKIKDSYAYILDYSGIPVLHQKEEYYELIEKCIRIINKGLVSGNGKNIAVYSISHPEKDDFLGKIVKKLSSYGAVIEYEPNEGWNQTLLNQHWGYLGVDDEFYDSDPYKDLEYWSKSVERIMHLAPANWQEKTQPKRSHKKNASLAKERRQMSRDIDEYDERYYQCN